MDSLHLLPWLYETVAEEPETEKTETKEEPNEPEAMQTG